MPDDGKFGIEVNVDTSKATKNLKDLNKEAEKANDTLNEEHEVHIDTDKAQKSLDDIDKKLNNVSKKVDSTFNVGKLFLWYEGIKKVGQAAYAAGKYVVDAANEMTSMSNTAQGLSISTNTLKAWETTFKAMGFDAKEADNALGAIQDRLTGQLLNPSIQVASAFSMMGVNLRNANGELRNSDDILGEVAGKLKNFKPEYAIAIGAQLGLSRDQAIQLRNNPDFAKTLAAQKANQVITPQQVKAASGTTAQAAGLGAEMDKLQNDALLPLNTTLSKDIAPNLAKIAEKLGDTYGGGSTQDIADRAKGFFSAPFGILGGGLKKFGVDSYNRLTTPLSDKEQSDVMKRLKNTIKEIQGFVESGNKPDAVGYAMTRNAQGKYTYKLDPTGNKIPEAYGKYQIKPSTASEVMGYNVTPQMLLNEQFNTQVRDKLMAQLLKKYGTQERALAAYNGDLKRYDQTGSAPYVDKIKSNLQTVGMSNAPMATQSSTVTNNLINQNRHSTINSSTSIGNVNVSANNPQEFAKELQSNIGYLDKILNMNGQLA